MAEATHLLGLPLKHRMKDMKDYLFVLPNTSMEIKETTVGTTQLVLLNFTDSLASQIGAMSGALYIIDVLSEDRAYVAFSNVDGSISGWLEYTPSADTLEFNNFSNVKLLSPIITEIYEMKVTQIDSNLKPKTNNAYDIGYYHVLPFLRSYWKNLYLSGSAYVDTIQESTTNAGVTIPKAGDITFLSGKILNAINAVLRLPNSPSASPSSGDTYFDATTNKLYIYNGTAWVSVTLT